MLLDLARTGAPQEKPVSLAEAKARLNIVASDDDDELIDALISAAAGLLDGYEGVLGRALITQTWRLRLPGFHLRQHRAFASAAVARADPAACLQGLHHPQAIRLPLPPLQSVTGITYADVRGVTQTLDPTAYQVLDGNPAEILPAIGTCFPTTQPLNPRAVSITFVAGFADDGAGLDAVAPGLRQAILLLVGHWYRNREAVVGVDARDSSTELPIGVSALIAPYRLIPV